MIAPAIAVPMNANRSVRMCWKLPSTLRLWRLALASVEHRQQVHDDTDERDDDDQPGAHLRRRDEAVDRLVDDDQGEHEQRDAIDLGGEDLDALEAVGHRALRRPLGQAHCDEREPDRGGIREHVRRV